MKTFAEKIKEARQERGMLQEDFAKLLGVSRRMLVDYENGDSRPYRKRMLEIAAILEVPPLYLIDDRCHSVLEVFNQPSDTVRTAVEQQKKELESQAISEMEFLKERSAALFAGGDLPPAYKDAFFQSMYQAYLKSKQSRDSHD